MRTLLLVGSFALLPGLAFADAKADLMAADQAFSKLSVEKGTNAAFLSYMSDEPRIFGTGNRPPIIGKAEATARFSSGAEGNGDPKKNVLRWVADFAETSADGTLGATDGHWTFTGDDGKGGTLTLTGHYVTTWKKDASGAWKVIQDMGTTDPAK
jgi:ketosteroid isomerase-like protein